MLINSAPVKLRRFCRGGFIRDAHRISKQMPTPPTKRVEVRLPLGIVSEIDALVRAGVAPTRADYVYRLIVSDIKKRRIETNIKSAVLEIIRTDPEVRTEIYMISNPETPD